MFGVQGEGVPEQVVWSFLKWNTTKRIEVTGVSFAKLGWEGAICPVGSQGHVAEHSEGRGNEESREEGRDLTIVVVLEASEVVLPAGVELPKDCQLQAHVEQGSVESEVTDILHALVEALEIGD